jgi:DNA-binding Xre family transcriptional regulator
MPKMDKMKNTLKHTRLHELIVMIPKDTRVVIKEIQNHTGIPMRKLQRLRNGQVRKIDLTDATLLSNYLNQYLEDVRPEDLINTLPELTRKIKLKEAI